MKRLSTNALELVQMFGTERVSDRAHIGNRWSNFAGLGWHDNIARWHDAILDRFTTPDPKPADYPSFSPYQPPPLHRPNRYGYILF